MTDKKKEEKESLKTPDTKSRLVNFSKYKSVK